MCGGKHKKVVRIMYTIPECLSFDYHYADYVLYNWNVGLNASTSWEATGEVLQSTPKESV